ncbi:MAG: hypothetical protein JST58_09805 [Bacteroidetes bacterium]|nr:hypothetical protein [Bacteroidota bacterium]
MNTPTNIFEKGISIKNLAQIVKETKGGVINFVTDSSCLIQPVSGVKLNTSF